MHSNHVINVEETPNPNSIKFTTSMNLIGDDMWECDSEITANYSPLAKLIWDINRDHESSIVRVFFHEDMVVVTKSSDISWDLIKNKIKGAIRDHIISGLPIVYSSIDAGNNENQNIISKITEVMKDYIQPALAQHGGFATLKSFHNGIVVIAMHGACNGCPSSDETMSFGISSILKLYVPGVKEVQLCE